MILPVQARGFQPLGFRSESSPVPSVTRTLKKWVEPARQEVVYPRCTGLKNPVPRAPVVQRITHQPPELGIQVQFLAGVVDKSTITVLLLVIAPRSQAH